MTSAPDVRLNGVHAEAGAARRRGGRRWIAFPIALMAAHAGIVGTMMYRATSDATFAVEPDYYQKALDWDATAAQHRTNERLAWRTELGVQRGAGGTSELALRLTNAAGGVLDGATVRAEVFASARSRERRTLEFASRGDGRYAAPAEFEREGIWACRLHVVRGPETFTADLEFTAPNAGGRAP